MREKRPAGLWGDVQIELGQQRDVELPLTESFSGAMVKIPIHVRRGPEEGPVIFVTAALHGDEINGTGAIRALIGDQSLQPRRGSVLLVPVLNPQGFDRHTRYLPDRRDLNRCFPGFRSGSLASRMARIIFDELVARSDYGIDLHTAAVRRTNFPNIRADMSKPEVRKLAKAFGCEFIINGKGPKGALRRAACKAGCPTIIMEGGEVWKVEPAIVECAARGVRNVLAHFGMIDESPHRPPFQITLEKTKWIRADRGGFLQFHVSPGQVIRAGQPLATNTSLLGHEQSLLSAPFDGVVLGMTTLPAVSPGEPVCHLALLTAGTGRVEQIRSSLPEEHPHGRLIEDLATNVLVFNREPEGGNTNPKRKRGDAGP